MTRRAVLTLLAAIVAAPRVEGHHSFAAEFDAAHPREFAGAVVVMQWVNPHAVLTLDVREAGGRVARWDLELPPPAALRRRGLTPRDLRPGEPVVVKGYPAKDGRQWASTQWVELPGGRRVVTGTPGASN